LLEPGDELQGIKRGIMEMADVIVINKADGDNIRKAELAKFKRALHLFLLKKSGWTPTTSTCSAIIKMASLKFGKQSKSF
jgi:LAO/AO transport system kinase